MFRQAVAAALQWQMVGLVLHAVDRTKIAADVSKERAWHRADLARLLERLDTALVEAEEQVEAAEQSERGTDRSAFGGPIPFAIYPG